MSGKSTASFDSNFSFLKRSEILLSVALLGVLVVLIIPLPAPLLDMLLATNLGITVLLLLIVLGVTHPLDISVFPSLLLLLTLYRLSLNVATTRLVLLDGDAGRIVSTFGGYVVGGNLVVGMVIFLILVIVQFIVITKGASRVSEVAARFTLDALPGKQMAIDAELGAGTIDETSARERRQHLAREAEFYGAMDGAGKFVRGDAIAGLVVTAVNLLGGMVMGISRGLTIGEAAARYSTLTVGDGLVSQIPALIIATSAGLLVTKAGSEVTLGQEIETQVLSHRRPLLIGSCILFLLGLVPGLPTIPFLALSGGLFFLVRRLRPTTEKADSTDAEEETAEIRREEGVWQQFLQNDRACIEIGLRLVPLVESRRTKGLADRIPGLRQDLTRKHGIWVPPVRIRDNIQVDSEAYRILIAGRQVASGEVRPDHLLAIAPGGASVEIEGEKTTDPAFGIPAVWIGPANRQRAEIAGYTVIDAVGVIVTHLGEVLRRYAHELLSREDLQQLLNKVKETAPTVIDEMKPEVLRIGTLHQVLVLLLQERVPVTDLTFILESLLNWAPQTKIPAELAEHVRTDMGRAICDRFRDPQGHVRVIVLDPYLEMYLRESLIDNELSLKPANLEAMVSALNREWQKAAAAGDEVAVLTDRQLRRPLRRTIQRALPDLAVIAYTEIPSDMLMNAVTMIRRDEVDRTSASAGDVPHTSALEEEIGAVAVAVG
jgi:flagellar biosynthesis protein FlhA